MFHNILWRNRFASSTTTVILSGWPCSYRLPVRLIKIYDCCWWLEFGTSAINNCMYIYIYFYSSLEGIQSVQITDFNGKRIPDIWTSVSNGFKCQYRFRVSYVKIVSLSCRISMDISIKVKQLREAWNKLIIL